MFAAGTFHETFAHSTSAHDMAEHLATHYGELRQAAEIVDPQCVTLVVDEGDVLAAYAQVRQGIAPDCVRRADSRELWRFYVDKALHGSGIAQRLMMACVAAATELGGSGLWLSVWEHNDRALVFYRKVGFVEVGSAPFWLGADRQTDRILLLEVDTPGSERRVAPAVSG